MSQSLRDKTKTYAKTSIWLNSVKEKIYPIINILAMIINLFIYKLYISISTSIVSELGPAQLQLVCPFSTTIFDM